ncbi:MAG: hypothetical protein AAF849_01400 [Bacteroidota bacterium]
MKNITSTFLPFLFALLPLFSIQGCSESDLASPATGDSSTGVGGSYARFIVIGDFMYIVDETDLMTFDVKQADEPVLIDQQSVGEQIESIFNFKDKLFIGSGEGLFIYAITDSGLPKRLSATSYFEFEIFPCDPVVANDSIAYVTLNALRRVNSACGGAFEVNVNLLKIFDITDVENPSLIVEHPFFAPKGLGLDGSILFICDHTEGLKIFDVSDPYADTLDQIAHINNITAFDVIPLDGLLLVVGPDNVYEYDYTDLDNIKLISSFAYGN